MRLSHLLSNLPPYHFAEYARKIAERRAAGADIINLSMGDPDLPTPPEVIEALAEAAHDPANQRYPEYAGMPELRAAFAQWFAGRFGVTLDATREVLPLIGSKEGLAHLPMVTMDPGDIAIITDPAYPVYPTAIALAGGVAHALPLDVASGWLPDLGVIPDDVARRARTLWLNYPNNPTGASAPRAFFEAAVRFARAHDVLLVHDTAYSEVRFDGARPASILEVEGAKEVAVEFHSLSKAYNMAGFRVGMLVGNASVVEGMTRLKSNLDSGIFRPIQHAAIRAMALPAAWLDARNAIYQARRDRLVAALRRLDMAVESPQAGLYLWPRIPTGYSAAAFALLLLERADVAVTPGTNFGAHGEGYVRISLTTPDARLDEAIARMEAAITARA
ncbi:MAG: LL-diaminopimelate aminotransferase [Ktedonobacterales bacterium]|nr:LL-diaminopimelate aminotransferase [Ktedonobacterales bacterium]